MKQNAKVDHPQHYGGDTVYEPIKIVDAFNLNFCLGNVIKYVLRAGRKPGEPKLDDLKKALWYLQHEVNKLEKEEAQRNDYNPT